VCSLFNSLDFPEQLNKSSHESTKPTGKKSPLKSELNLDGGRGQNRTADTRIFKKVINFFI
jgi:hypothetical protein